MKIARGTFVSDGARRTLDLGFRPAWFIIKGDTTQNLAQRTADIWVGRTNTLVAAESFLDGVAFVQDSVVLGAAAQVNSTGVRYYWFAVGDDGSEDFATPSWIGNGQAGNVLQLGVSKLPIAAFVKRDSTLAAAVKFTGAPAILADGNTVAEVFSDIAPGNVTLTAVTNVNQYDSAGGLGEGIDGFFAFDGSNAWVVSWSAGTSGQFIDCGGDPEAALITRVDTTGVATRFLTKDMPSSFAAPVSNVALTVNEATLVPGGIQLGSAATLRTGTFFALVFNRKDESEPVRPPAILVKNRRAIFLPGRGTAAQVDCGTSDATLKISGELTLEWYGVVWADQYASTVGAHLLERGVGPAASAGAYSWGIAGAQVQDLSWSGPQLAAITTNQWNETAPLDAAVWRTGVLMPYGNPFHVMVVHSGNGRWRMHLNGRLVKQRRINLATNVQSGAAHRTGFGMRRNTADSAWTQAQKMLIFMGRVYAHALSVDDCAARFEREVMGSTTPDITTELAEWWNCSYASGTSLPAQVNSQNNGTISAAGRIVTL